MVGKIVNKDRFLKGHCIPFIVTNISGRSPYFLHYKLIKPAEIKPKKSAVTNQYMRDDDYNEEKERIMLEFNNNLI